MNDTRTVPATAVKAGDRISFSAYPVRFVKRDALTGDVLIVLTDGFVIQRMPNESVTLILR